MTWIVDGRTFARKVKNPGDGLHRHGGSYKCRSIECPACGNLINQSHAAQDWPGLPAGVKFDPSDSELLEHLAAKVEVGAAKPHPFIDEFIPTLEEEDGICYTHPEKLPGIRRDGSSTHFFHRPAKAYTTGTRKRRKIQAETDKSGCGGEVRWHKTGKTRPVVENGKQLGCKKIMVLYISFGKKAKPDKTNWVMHQYHLGVQEEEKEGEFVVSKVFYQTQPRLYVGARKGDDENLEQMEVAEEPAQSFPQSSASVITTSCNSQGSPLTPGVPAPWRPRAGKQHRGLLETISEEVDRITASLTANAMNTNWSPDQNIWSTDLTEADLDWRSELRFQTTSHDVFQGTTEQGEQDTCSSFEGTNRCDNDYRHSSGDGFQAHQVDDMPRVCTLGSGSQEFFDGIDTDIMKLLCDENLQVDPTLEGDSRKGAEKNFHSLATELEISLDDMPEEEGEGPPKAAPCLENVILDTPPDLLLESFLNSQDTLDWLGKRKFGGSSQETTGAEDFNAVEYLQDSQSTT